MTDVDESVIEDAIEEYSEWLCDGNSVELVRNLYKSSHALNWLFHNTDITKVPHQYRIDLILICRLITSLEKDIEARIAKNVELANDY